jgi:hypothetical protein
MDQHIHRCAVGGFEYLRCQHLSWGAVGDHGFVETQNPGQVSGESVQVVSGQHDGDAFSVEISKDMKDFVTRADIHPRGWFVEDDETRALCESSGEEHPLLLAS